MINLFEDLNLLQHFLDTSEDFVFIIRMEDAKLLFANSTACNRLGYSREELETMEISDWRQPLGDNRSFREHLERLKQESALRSYGILSCKDGSKIEVETSVKLVTYEGVDYDIAISRDITDWLASQRREQELLERLKQEHELELQSLLLNSVTDSIFVHRHDGSFIYVNEAAYKSRGYTKEEMMKLSVQDLDYHDNKVGKEVYEENMQKIMTQMQTKGEASFEVLHKGKNGRIIPIEVHSKIIQVVHEKYFISIARDISEQRKRQRQLEIIDNFQTQFIEQSDPFEMYEKLKDDLLSLTESDIGFIGETQNKADGSLFLKVYSISNIAWDEATNKLYDTYCKIGFEFSKLDNLFGRVVTQQKVILSNDPQNDPRASGFPPGHPKLHSFLGIPIFYGDQLVGEIGLANRKGGYDESIVEMLKPLTKTCGQIIVARQNKEARELAEQQLKEQARRDALTGLYNRGYFNESFNREWRRCAREKIELSLIMIDIDFFKSYNDTYGHLKGDECLIKIAGILQSCLKRPADMVARYGGEEFIAMLPNTDRHGAMKIAQCFRQKLVDTAIEHKDSKVASSVTLSAGIATQVPQSDGNLELLIKLADDRLYEAKNSGRDRVVFDGFD